jgi:hypothetical protein
MILEHTHGHLMPKKYPTPVPFVFGLLLILGGCATTEGPSLVPAAEMRVNERGQIADTGFEAIDLVVACNIMLHGFGTVPEIAQNRGSVRIAVEPVANDTRFAVDESTFNDVVLGQLRLRAPRQWIFVATHEGSDSDVVDYYLAGRLQRLMPIEPTAHEVLLYGYQLIDARNSEINWEGSAELKNHTLVPKPLQERL